MHCCSLCALSPSTTHLEPKSTRHPRKASPLPRPPTSTTSRAKRIPSSHTPGLEGKPTTASSSTTHHVEEHLRTDVHTGAPLHWKAATLRKHLARVDEVFTAVVSVTFLGIAQCFIRFPYIFESLRCTLIVRILVGVMHNGQLSISLLDLVVIGILFHPEDLVVVLALRFLELKLCVSNVLLDTRLLGVRFGNGFEFGGGGLPVARFAESTSFGLAGFYVSGIEGEGAGAVRDGRFVIFKLY